MDFLKKRAPQIFLGAVVMGVVFFSGYHVGQSRAKFTLPAQSLSNITEGQPATIDFSPFWKAWNIINEKYVATSTSTKPTTDQDKVWGAISGMTSSLGDPYTVFFPPSESEQFASDIRGNFEGIGMEVVAKDGALQVIAPLKGSPSERAGILAVSKRLM